MYSYKSLSGKITRKQCLALIYITALVFCLVGCSTTEKKNTSPVSGHIEEIHKVPPQESEKSTGINQADRKLQAIHAASHNTATAEKNQNTAQNDIYQKGREVKEKYEVHNTESKKIAKYDNLSEQSITKDTDEPVEVELAFNNADLYEVLDATLYNLYKVDYMVDPTIKAKVTFHITGKYTKLEFINALNNVLQLNNLAIVKGPGNIWKIVRKSLNAGLANTGLIRGKKRSKAAGDVTRLIKIRYMSTAAAAKNIKPFLSRGAVLVQDTVSNALIITDTPENIEKVAGILGALDVPYFSDLSWRLFFIKEADATDLAKDLDKLLKTGGMFNRPGVNQGAYQIIPIKTMNALLVVTKWPSMLTLIGHWIDAMDQVYETGTNVFVYFVQNGSAAELADILKQVFGGGTEKKTKRVQIVKPVKKPSGTLPSGELLGEVKIIPDETNNAIVIKANRRDYQLIKEVLKQLDIVPRQVLIDVMVAEVTLDGSVEYGVEWFIRNHIKDYTTQAVLDNQIKRAVSEPLGTATAFTYGVYDPYDFMRGLIHALGKDSQVNILSAPNILAVDNKEAVIEVGEEVPTVTGKVTDATSGSTVTSTIEYRKTGVLLTVTPHINSNGLVKMELKQEVSAKGTYDSALNTYSILSRRAETSVVVENGQTILMGGLMKSHISQSGSGIPYLRKIPLLGHLMGSESRETKKTELIFLITPHVITTRAEADAITREFSEKVKRLKQLINSDVAKETVD